ncbi:iron-dependent extradiol dioxygenase domain protein [Mycobacterium xenopi 3993]|nr:iron-dependent extradiol dioxygenase domain protein [Mycobacterium xenopi 3993]
MSDLKSLGYITISTKQIERWRHFAFGVLGFAEGKGPDESALYLRMDERAADSSWCLVRPTGCSPLAGRYATTRAAAR